MNNTTVISEKPLMPTLFQITASAHDVKSVSGLALAWHRTPLAEIMLDAQRLEQMLNSIALRKKRQRRVFRAVGGERGK
jgi:hypothetical protein